MSCYVNLKNDNGIFKHKENVYYLKIDLSGIQKYIFNNYHDFDVNVIKNRSSLLDYILNNIHTYFMSYYHNQYFSISYVGGNLEAILKNDINIKKVEELLQQIQKECIYITEGQLHIHYAYQLCRIYYTNKKRNTFLKKKDEIEVHSLIREKIENMKYHFPIIPIDNIQLKILHQALINDNVDIHYHHASALKFDLDNLGMFFSNIKEIDVISEVSQYLYKNINTITNIDYAAVILAGGDDIYIICDYKDTYRLALHIYSELKKKIEEFELLDSYTYSLSLGIVSYNEPTSMLYINEESEKQLEKAKDNGKNCVCFNDHFLSWNQVEELYKKVEELKINNHELNTIYLYDYIMGD